MISKGTENRKRVGLALGGGAARGMAHIGVLTILDQAGIPIDFVAGSSAGSIAGALYSSGKSIEELRRLSARLQWWKIARPVWPSRGLLSFDKLRQWLTYELGDICFEDLQKPFVAVATDLERGLPVQLCSGKLAPAIQASCSIPGLVVPVELDGKLLGDGCVTDTVPVSILRKLGAEYVIAVDVVTPKIRRSWGALGFGFAALEVLVDRAGGGFEQADCRISPDLGGKTYARLSKKQEFFLLGENSAMAKIDEIRSGLGL